MQRVLFLVASLICFTPPAFAETLTARVVGVTDGDTITVLLYGRQQQVRLSDIDAPESGQPFGSNSKQSLSDMVYGKEVELTVTDTDRYGRLIARVKQGGTDANLEQVNRGLAWAYRKYTRDERVLMAESAARVRSSGLWAHDDQTPPWEWREARRSTRGATSHESHAQGAQQSLVSSPAEATKSLDGFFADRDLDRYKASNANSNSITFSGGAAGGTYSGGQEIHTGPRGGRYVTTESGGKHYVGKGK